MVTDRSTWDLGTICEVLVIDSRSSVLLAALSRLEESGYRLVTDQCQDDDVKLLKRLSLDVAIRTLRLDNVAEVVTLEAPQAHDAAVALVVLASAVNPATRLIGQFPHVGRRRDSSGGVQRNPAVDVCDSSSDLAYSRCIPEPHALMRWAHAVVPLIDSPHDPRTIHQWSRLIAASPGAVRNWCRTAGIGARESLIFGRMLRAVILSEGGQYKPENLLDVVDRRTLTGLMKRAGLQSGESFPCRIEVFLSRQTLIHDSEAIGQIKRLLSKHRRDQKQWHELTKE